MCWTTEASWQTGSTSKPQLRAPHHPTTLVRRSAKSMPQRWGSSFGLLAARRRPKLEVLHGSNAVELHLRRGKEPAGGCDAVSILRGFVVTSEAPVDAVELKVVDHGD